ncbi:preprotein translocase subunit SecY [Nonlabens sp. MIC269]|uniref:preprotein translocase subunit SecY n=1 Tax=Nonlabens TaxID=363408 RepID=UPI00072247E5|nr:MULTISPECIES: preprotein translocase subunit SecY [Nonlabens]ALM20442.1 preprotein translocase subunit SecY [Nonlabens sp. MIC269]ARN70495.1 preprotein translocase subunit SecY [Nonlabens tegetincola]MEE2800616.1 preprotein translocase subunit SecY [Bacteroidota bacterium]PQJ19355.1 preprotein translocase subunit SecY [Nonlabens tegetincola]
MKFIDTLKNIWKIEELKDRILMTLSLLLVYRFGAQVVLPGIDSTKLGGFADNFDTGIGGILNAFTGGAFANASVFALGIMPYISASIVVQLMGLAIPYLQKLQKEGESGRRKINQITRWLTIGICVIQAPTYLLTLETLGVPQDAFIDGRGAGFITISTIILVTGCIFAMWLGEKITDKGIGNGISLLIMVGIIATLPQAFIQEITSRYNGTGGLFVIIIEVVIWLLVILACIMLVMAVRKIPVQYARRSATGSYEKVVGGAREYIPLKLNASGVMPIIFAQAIMFVPAAIGNLEAGWAKEVGNAFGDIFGFWYNLVFALLIIIFTYFYTAITVKTNEMADNLKRSNGFIPGIRPGTETADYLDEIMSLITLPGSVFLAAVAIFPAIVSLFGVTQAWALFYGGTSLLIMVGVAIDTMQQINAYLLNKHYDSLIKTGKNRKAVA